MLRCSVDVAGWLAAAVPTSARASPTIQSRCAIDAPNRHPHSRLMRRRRSDAPPTPTLGPTPASWSTQRGASPASSSTRRFPRRRPAHVSCRKLCATGRRLASSVGPGRCMPGSHKKRAWPCCPARVHLDPGTAPSPPRLCFQLRTAGAAAGRRGGLLLPPQPPQVSWQPRLLEAGTRSVNTELVGWLLCLLFDDFFCLYYTSHLDSILRPSTILGPGVVLGCARRHTYIYAATHIHFCNALVGRSC